METDGNSLRLEFVYRRDNYVVFCASSVWQKRPVTSQCWNAKYDRNKRGAGAEDGTLVRSGTVWSKLRQGDGRSVVQWAGMEAVENKRKEKGN
jgi:hypothetical protein